jgi:site-specific DNA-methyltransferase (adenine-specific)
MTNVHPLPEHGPPTRRRSRGTSTSNFGVGKRESHDASAFYARFVAPTISDSDEIARPVVVDEIWAQDAREMTSEQVADNSVALVVTSPPYFAGKEYEEALGQGHIPASYNDYLGMLHDVFAACVRKLEPGGRIAVNVANLGRKPYRSLSADVIAVFERLGLLLRGEIIWQKQPAAGGSCAWGSYQRPANPVLRDITERVIVASKGRFDRSLSPERRRAEHLPHEGSMFKDDFVDATTDLWEIPAESAKRVGHPAPFPVELPKRLIDLYTYRGDLVLDPFMGSGTSAVAALRTERHFVGFDTDAEYAKRALERVAEERERLERERRNPHLPSVVVPATRSRSGEDDDQELGFQARAVKQGRKAQELAHDALVAYGFVDIEQKVKYSDLGVEVNFRAQDPNGGVWLFDVSGAFSSTRPGLKRTDTLWKALGRATVLRAARDQKPARRDIGRLVLLTTDLPAPNSAGDRALRNAKSAEIIDGYFDLTSPSLGELAELAREGKRKK